MGKKLFVGGLPWGVTDARLSEVFSEFGQVREAKVIMDRDTGRSRGFGFVSFDSDADADRAIATMNGADLDGRTVNVNEAKEREQRGGGGGGGGGGHHHAHGGGGGHHGGGGGGKGGGRRERDRGRDRRDDY